MAAGRGRRGDEEAGGVDAHGGCGCSCGEWREETGQKRGIVAGYGVGGVGGCPWSCGYGDPSRGPGVWMEQVAIVGPLVEMRVGVCRLGAGQDRGHVGVIRSVPGEKEGNCSAAIPSANGKQMAIWHIWENRNAYRNGEALIHPLRMVGKIKAYVEFINMHSFSSTTSIRRETLKSNQSWSPPSEGLMLVNVDAAIFSQSARAGFGVVIRDHRGRVQVANRGYFERVQIPEVAEAMALQQALILANNTGMRKIMVASDCLSLINKIKGLGFDRSPTGAIVHDIRKCATKFVSCSLIHVNRSCNEAAHVLAKSAENDVWSWWINEFPDVIRTIICNESAMNE
ncbi:unnamed protein product [Triticum aestivum]|uniref:RNase H type-1 domain-containing protein n=1 Tax=Triticum aestivum TaxID=4565 RepID=A0A7H4LE47_WHEAT|nr:unnamed protein product [Triticum aestivum]